MDIRSFEHMTNEECFAIGDARIYEKKRIRSNVEWRNPLPRTVFSTYRISEPEPSSFLYEFFIAAFESPWPVVKNSSTLKEAMPAPLQFYGKVLSEFVLALLENTISPNDSYFNKFEYMIIFLCQKNIRVCDFFCVLFTIQSKLIQFNQTKKNELHEVQMNIGKKINTEENSLPQLLQFVPLEYLKAMMLEVIRIKNLK